MKFVRKEFTATLDEKKSKFLAFLMPYKDFDKSMKRLKTEHPKAVHHVYAYRYLNEFEQIVENCSDDGEPRGTSGKPSLAVLSGAGIINCAVIIVRYFGGIKLGTGGLVRAYSSSVNEVIKVSDFFEYKKLVNKTLECDYSYLSQLEYFLKELKINIVSQEFLMKVRVNIELTKEEFEDLSKNLAREVNIL